MRGEPGRRRVFTCREESCGSVSVPVTEAMTAFDGIRANQATHSCSSRSCDSLIPVAVGVAGNRRAENIHERAIVPKADLILGQLSTFNTDASFTCFALETQRLVTREDRVRWNERKIDRYTTVLRPHRLIKWRA